jgi:hypothetical protein
MIYDIADISHPQGGKGQSLGLPAASELVQLEMEDYVARDASRNKKATKSEATPSIVIVSSDSDELESDF